MARSNRRSFLEQTTLSAAVAASTVASQSTQASERIRVGVMGGSGRAASLINTFAKDPGAEIVAIADIDPGRLGKGIESAEKIQGNRVRPEKDFRKIVDDSSIDAHL